MKPTIFKRLGLGKSTKMPSESLPKPEDININEIDIWADNWEDIEKSLTEEQKDALIERERLRSHMHIVPTVPCECNWCNNWIDNTELFRRIGCNNEKIICLSCAGDME
jgi:hypothetical protein